MTRIAIREIRRNLYQMGKLTNIPALFQVVASVRGFNKNILEIEKAVEAGDSKAEKELIAEASYDWASDMAKRFQLSVEVHGRENIPEKNGLVFISNHQGYGDIMILFLALQGKQVGFIAKDSLEKVPYFGKWIKAIGGYFIQRKNPKDALRSLSKGAEHLKSGYNLAIFPEGTRSKGPEMSPFKAGSFKLATMAKATIVPVTINGSYHLFEEKGYCVKGTHASVTIHPPVDTEGLNRKELAQATADIEETIRSAINESPPEE